MEWEFCGHQTFSIGPQREWNEYRARREEDWRYGAVKTPTHRLLLIGSKNSQAGDKDSTFNGLQLNHVSLGDTRKAYIKCSTSE